MVTTPTTADRKLTTEENGAGQPALFVFAGRKRDYALTQVASRSEVAPGAAGLDLGRVVLGVAVALGLAVIAFDSGGGYFPTAWKGGAP